MRFDNLIENLYRELKDAGIESLGAVTAKYIAADVKWCVAHPVNDLTGRDQVVEHFLKPLLMAMPDIERKPFVMLSAPDSMNKLCHFEIRRN